MVNLLSGSVGVLHLAAGEFRALPEERDYWALDGDLLLAVSGTVGYLCDAEGRELHALVGHKGHIVRAHLSPHRRRAITLSRDQTARLWSTEDGRLLGVLPHDGIAWDAVFSPDGKRVYTASFDGWVRCWHADEIELLERARSRAAPFDYTEGERARYRARLVPDAG